MKVQEIPDFETVVRNRPLELHVQVEFLLHVPMKAKYLPLMLIKISVIL